MNHPFLHAKKTFLYYCLAWIAVTAIQVSVVHFYYQVSFSSSLMSSLVLNGLFFFIGLGLWYPIRFIYQSKGQPVSDLLNFLGLGAVTVFVWNTLSSSIIRFSFPEDSVFQEILNETLIIKLVLGSMAFLIVTLVYYLLLYFSSLEQKKISEARLESLVRQSELNLLKFKLNPHFLFNSLNSISSLTISQPEKAQEMIIKLSNFLRYSLESDKSPIQELRNELENIHLYLEIEKIRFGNRIDYIEDLSEKCLDQDVPTMILQPLFENAIKHGVGESSDTVRIKFECSRVDSFLLLQLTNDTGPAMSTKSGTGNLNKIIIPEVIS